MAHTTGQSRFLTVGGLKLAQLQSGWENGCEGLNFALNLVRSNTGISSPALLASPFLLISLGFYGAQRSYSLSPKEAAGLVRWMLLTNAKGRYSRGSSDSLLDQDLKTIREGGSYIELLDRLRTQVGRLDIAPEELEGRSQRSALFKTQKQQTSPPPSWLEASIDSLSLSIRANNALHYGGYRLVRDLCGKQAEDLLSIRNFGSKSLEELQERLSHQGIPFPVPSITAPTSTDPSENPTETGWNQHASNQPQQPLVTNQEAAAIVLKEADACMASMQVPLKTASKTSCHGAMQSGSIQRHKQS